MSKQQIVALAAETGVHAVTVERWSYGGPVGAGTDYALKAACAKLRIPTPKNGRKAK